MANYTMQKIQDSDCTYYAIFNNDSMEYFAGYDFMGSATWEKHLDDCSWLLEDEAYQIKADLESADADDEQQAPAFDQDEKSTGIKPETILRYLQARYTDALEEGKKYGQDDRIYRRKIEQCIGMKELVEELLRVPVNLQRDGLVTTGF